MSTPFRRSLTLSGIAGALDKAFAMPETPAVALIVNSPGGSAVQSRLIHRRVRDLADENDKLVLVFVEDVAASGGYMIATAGDEIIADPSSIVGSIGVVGAFFGFDRLIEKIGVDRRVYTAGDRKVSLDPFLPEKSEDVTRLKAMQKDIHRVFIDVVKERRGDLLLGTDKQLFSGEFWTGQKSLELGLIDSLGDIRSVIRDRFGDKTKLKLIPSDGSRFWRRGSVDVLGGERSSFAEDWVATLETRAMWSRYGL